MSPRRVPRDADSGPIDVGAVNHDDAFIDDLAAGRPTHVTDQTEYDLAAMITAWRMDAVDAPIPAEPTLAQIDDAMKVRDGRGSLSRRLRIVSGAAAILAVLGAGMMVMSESAEPGDALWKVKQVVFAEQAKSTEARISVEENLSAAQAAFEAGDTERGQQLISEAEAELGPVKEADVVAQLRMRIEDLRDGDVDDEPTVTATTEPTSPSEEPTDSTDPSTPPTSTTDDDKPTSSTPSSTTPSSSTSTPASTPTTKPKPTEPPRPSVTLTIPVPFG